MADKFEIEVPISVRGDTGKSKTGEKIAEQIKKSLSSIGIGKEGKSETSVGFTKKGGLKLAGVLGAILGALDSLMFIIKPVLDLLKVAVMLLFLPLIPFLKPTLKGLAWLVKILAVAMKWQKRMWEKIMGMFGEGLSWIWENLLKPIWDGLKEAILGGWKMLKNAGQWIWNDVIVPAFDFLKDAGIWIWKMFVVGFSNVINFGIWLWELIKKGFDFWIDIGKKLWNFIKGLFTGTISVGTQVWEMFKGFFKGTISVAGKVWNWFKGLFRGRGSSGGSSNKKTSYTPYDSHSSWDDFISRPGQNPISFSPQDTIIGVKDPSALGGNSITVQINNPSVRNDMDIKKIANQVSQVLQRQMSGRIVQ